MPTRSADLEAPRLICSIHQPNLFPRRQTVLKLFASDIWIVLDDVQYVRNDYQNRFKLAPMRRPSDLHWVSLPVRLPFGRASLICDVRPADGLEWITHLRKSLVHHYGMSSARGLAPWVDEVAEFVCDQESTLADLAFASTHSLLRAMGWPGAVLHARSLRGQSRPRSEGIQELCAAVGATDYLSGDGGVRYLDVSAFAMNNVAVTFIRTDVQSVERQRSCLDFVARVGQVQSLEQFVALSQRLRHAVRASTSVSFFDVSLTAVAMD